MDLVQGWDPVTKNLAQIGGGVQRPGFKISVKHKLPIFWKHPVSFSQYNLNHATHAGMRMPHLRLIRLRNLRCPFPKQRKPGGVEWKV